MKNRFCSVAFDRFVFHSVIPSSLLGGSSRFVYSDGCVKFRSAVRSELESAASNSLSDDQYARFVEPYRLAMVDLFKEPLTSDFEPDFSECMEIVGDKVLRKRYYRFKYRTVLERCVAAFRLRQFRKFSSFWSISFPLGTPDELALKCFNYIRTRLSRDYGKFSYIRTCEYQKNGTIHFHVLINKFFDVQVLNEWVGQWLSRRGLLKTVEGRKIEVSDYHGCDVKRVFNQSGVQKYLSKYLSKNNGVMSVRPMLCSRDISMLFTRVNVDCKVGELAAKQLSFDGVEGHTLVACMLYENEFSQVIANYVCDDDGFDYCRLDRFPTYCDKLISQVNQSIYDEYQRKYKEN